MLGLLPPSSRVTGIRFSEAYWEMRRPVVVSPVKAILRMRLLEASGLPASTPKPLTTLITPAGRTSVSRLIRYRIDAGVCSAGLRTTQLPAASAGPASDAIRIGSSREYLATTPRAMGCGVLRLEIRPPVRGSHGEVADDRSPGRCRRRGSRGRLPFSTIRRRRWPPDRLHQVGDLVEDCRALGDGGLAQAGAAGVPGPVAQLDILASNGHLRRSCRRRARFSKLLALDRRTTVRRSSCRTGTRSSFSEPSEPGLRNRHDGLHLARR